MWIKDLDLRKKEARQLKRKDKTTFECIVNIREELRTN